MFDYIRGTVIRIEEHLLVLENQGVGYEVYIPARLSSEFIVGRDEQVYIHEYVSETEHALYGFESQLAKIVFRHLINISGVGPKLAIRFLDRFSASQVLYIIANKNLALLREVKGLGSKTGEKLIIELQKKSQELLHTHEIVLEEEGKAVTKSQGVETPPTSVRDEILAALIGLGYRETQVRVIIDTVTKNAPEETTEELLKRVLEQLAKL